MKRGITSKFRLNFKVWGSSPIQCRRNWPIEWRGGRVQRSRNSGYLLLWQISLISGHMRCNLFFFLRLRCIAFLHVLSHGTYLPTSANLLRITVHTICFPVNLENIASYVVTEWGWDDNVVSLLWCEMIGVRCYVVRAYQGKWRTLTERNSLELHWIA